MCVLVSSSRDTRTGGTGGLEGPGRGSAMAGSSYNIIQALHDLLMLGSRCSLLD